MNQKKTQIIEVIEWHSIFRDVIRNFWVVVLAGIIAFLGIYIAERSVYSPEYTSTATLVIRAKTGSSGVYTNLEASAEMANIYTKVFTQSSMKNLAAENAGYESFDGEIKTSVHSSTNLMSLSVTSSKPETAYILLESVLEVYPRVSDAVFSNGVIDILVSPEMPTAPSNTLPSSRRVQLSVLAAAAMFAVIVVFSFLRGTIKNEKLFYKKIDGYLLGAVSHEKRPWLFWSRLIGQKRALLTDTAFSSMKFSEDYQHIATKMEYMRKNNGSKVFTVTSVAENEGKSTTSANLALALANRGYNVVLIDMDMRKPAMHKIFDSREKVNVDFSDVLSRKIPPKEYKFLRYKKTSLFIAVNRKPCPDVSEWLGSGVVRSCIDSIKAKADFIIMDTPPTSVCADAMGLIKMSDKAILVVRTDCVEAADINDTIMTIRNVGGSFAGCILNDVYKPFTLFGQMGVDVRGYGYYKKYGSEKPQRRGYQKKVLIENLLDTDTFSSDEKA